MINESIHHRKPNKIFETNGPHPQPALPLLRESDTNIINYDLSGFVNKHQILSYFQEDMTKMKITSKLCCLEQEFAKLFL